MPREEATEDSRYTLVTMGQMPEEESEAPAHSQAESSGFAIREMAPIETERPVEPDREAPGLVRSARSATRRRHEDSSMARLPDDREARPAGLFLHGIHAQHTREAFRRIRTCRQEIHPSRAEGHDQNVFRPAGIRQTQPPRFQYVWDSTRFSQSPIDQSL